MTRSDDLQFAKLDCNSVDINELFSTDKFELSVYPFDWYIKRSQITHYFSCTTFLLLFID